MFYQRTWSRPHGDVEVRIQRRAAIEGRLEGDDPVSWFAEHKQHPDRTGLSNSLVCLRRKLWSNVLRT